LAQEMSPLDEQFRKRLERIFLDWQEGIATLLRKGKSQGTVRHDLNPDEAANFLIATVEGYATLAKNAQDAKVWKAGIRNIVGWLGSLRPPANLKGRTNNDKDHNAAEESAQNGSLRAGRCGDPTRTGKGQRIGSA
jgi:hypothetical protein